MGEFDLLKEPNHAGKRVPGLWTSRQLVEHKSVGPIAASEERLLELAEAGYLPWVEIDGRGPYFRLGVVREWLHANLFTEHPDGLCISYTPVMQDGCYNASLLGAELLARTYTVTGETALRDVAERAVQYVVARQHADGRWNYSVDLDTGAERAQVDFHQGFVLDSLYACMTHAGLDDPAYDATLRRGAQFYYEQQFTNEGRALWRLPKRWPSDIHCQAQGVITFSKLHHLDPAYGPFAERIAAWTIRHMQDPEGFFYYRRGRVFTNRIPYMRWGQAWMMLALAHLPTSAKGSSLSPSDHQTLTV